VDVRRRRRDRARAPGVGVPRHPALRLGLLAGLVVTAFILVASSGSLSADGLRDRIDGYGVAGPLVFVAVSTLLTPALFPGPLLAGAAGLLFGTALGTPLAIIAATLGATLAFVIARFLAHDAVEQMQGPRLRALRSWVGERGFLSVLYARIAPGVPYSLVNYAAGLSPIALRSFVAATAIGCSPRAFAYAALGGSFGDFGKPETVIALIVLVGMAALGLFLARRDLSAAAASRAAATGARARGRGPVGSGTATSSPDGPTADPQ
jgi:uncharacterized membrane protein YdjX (TVP38/TMEM64 family)